MNKKKIINIIVGVAIIAIGVLMWQNMQSQQQPAEPPKDQSGAPANGPAAGAPPQPSVQAGIVVVAKRDIARGTPISREMVRSVKVGDASGDDIESEDVAIGKIATIDIMVGERLTRQKISIRQGEQQLADRVPAGKRALTIPIDKLASLEGMIRPNDRVDMIGTFPIPSMASGGKPQNVVVPMFENIQVLAVGSSITTMGEKNYDSITFALSQEEASLLIYALQMGIIRLLLRSPEDFSVSQVKMPVTLDVLYGKLFAIQQQQQGYPAAFEEEPMQEPQASQHQQISEPAPDSPQVEVFTGGENSGGRR